MKIKPEHYEVLKAAINKLDRTAIFNHAESLKSDARVKDLSKRLRWDCFWATGLKLGDGVGVHGELPLYEYMHDSHIDTALKQIMKDLHILC